MSSEEDIDEIRTDDASEATVEEKSEQEETAVEEKPDEGFGMEAFDVTELSETGVRVDLDLPDGTKTPHFLMVRGQDAPTFRAAQAEWRRDQGEIVRRQSKGQEKNKMSAAQIDAKSTALERRVVAALVAGWSFDKECSIDNVAAFFRTAPQVQQQVNAFAADREHFFNKPSTD